MVQEMDFIRQLFHQKYSTASFRLNTLFAGRVWKFKRIKTAAFVGDHKLNLVLPLMTRHHDLLMFVEPVAMDDGIVDRFGETDQDIGIEILVDVQTLDQVPDKILDITDASGMRG